MSNKAENVSNHVPDAPVSSGMVNSGKSIFPDDIQTIKAKNPKVDFSKTELLKLLCYMEGELQARDIVIAVLKVRDNFERVNESNLNFKLTNFSRKR